MKKKSSRINYGKLIALIDGQVIRAVISSSLSSAIEIKVSSTVTYITKKMSLRGEIKPRITLKIIHQGFFNCKYKMPAREVIFYKRGKFLNLQVTHINNGAEAA